MKRSGIPAGWLDQPAAGWLDQPVLDRHGAQPPR